MELDINLEPYIEALREIIIHKGIYHIIGFYLFADDARESFSVCIDTFDFNGKPLVIGLSYDDACAFQSKIVDVYDKLLDEYM